ncbi:MAG TPA: hypothetical protein DIS66_02545 [Candidatus Omnitrophica bacterium]|nr:hypothetical protein [Candidatus Omnitrophota bacterium]
MIKKLIGIVFFAVIILVFTAVVFAKVILASVLTNVLGAPVQIGGLKLGSETGIYGLVIGNPAGFQEKRLASIPEASVSIDIGALFKGRIHVKRIKLAMEEATIEKGAGNKINLLELKVMKSQPKKQEPAKPQEEPQTKPEPSEPAKPGKPSQPAFTVQIDEVVLDLDKARYVDSGVTPASVKEYSLGVRNQSFKDVTNVASVVKQLAFFILKKVGMSSLTENFDVLLKGVGGEVGEKLGKLMEKLNNV